MGPSTSWLHSHGESLTIILVMVAKKHHADSWLEMGNEQQSVLKFDDLTITTPDFFLCSSFLWPLEGFVT